MGVGALEDRRGFSVMDAELPFNLSALALSSKRIEGHHNSPRRKNAINHPNKLARSSSRRYIIMARKMRRNYIMNRPAQKRHRNLGAWLAAFAVLIGGCASSRPSKSLDDLAHREFDDSNEQLQYPPAQIETVPSLKIESLLIWERPTALDCECYDLARIDVRRPTAAPDGSVEGYRVQVFSGQESSTAKRIQSKIQSLTGVEVYLLYEAPQYKVRVGDFADRNAATELCQQLRSQGYKEAWVVKSCVVPSRQRQ